MFTVSIPPLSSFAEKLTKSRKYLVGEFTVPECVSIQKLETSMMSVDYSWIEQSGFSLSILFLREFGIPNY